MLHHQDNGYCAAIGVNTYTPFLATEDDVLSYINENMWNVIFALAVSTTDTALEHWEKTGKKPGDELADMLNSN